jgi:hypothetical protein
MLPQSVIAREAQRPADVQREPNPGGAELVGRRHDNKWGTAGVPQSVNPSASKSMVSPASMSATSVAIATSHAGSVEYSGALRSISETKGMLV